MNTKTFDYKRVYVWQLPVRFFHWINVLTLTVLAISGFVIAYPPAIFSSAEASGSFWFGYVRMTHFIAAFIFMANLFFRWYWAFVGNEFASVKNLVPYNKNRWKNVFYVFRVDVLLMRDKEECLNNISVGHNTVAGLSYFGLMVLLFTQIFTGMALYAPTSAWFLPHMFEWVTSLFGGEYVVRYVHHFTTWLVIVFSIIHMYLVFFHDYIEGRGESSAMISGFKFVLKQRVKEKKE
jgi:Ni/Fe-hydrogenase 1 B-type cytochrome subunit